MRARHIVGIAAVAVLAGVVPASASASSGAAPAAHLLKRPALASAPAVLVSTGPRLRVVGAVTTPMRLTLGDISQMPSVSETVTFATSTGTETDTFEGPLLLNVLTAAGPEFDATVKNDQLRFAVVATGSDAYKAVVAWGEIDPNFGNKEMLVAYKQNGVRLTEPRLVVPGDIHGGRYVSDLVSLRLVDLGS